ncbi:MAG: FkbM family methyltransferase [Candidatus Kapaibacterium sp.]
MQVKKIIRTLLNVLHLDLNKGLEYDRLTKVILQKVIRQDSNCIDVGCHVGEILDIMLNQSPRGSHFGFEPIPSFYTALHNTYKNRATIYPYALSDSDGMTTFQFVKNAPAFSGIQKRQYAVSTPEIEEITVEMKKLDDVIPADIPITLIKIDVEGAEFPVLKGARNLLLRNKPTIIFECGLGASDFYGTKPESVYNFLTTDIGLKISTLRMYLNSKMSLSEHEFCDLYLTNKEYYFVAYP